MIEEDRWLEAPSLNFGRYYHSSICLGQLAFVFGGKDRSNNKIESHQVGTNEPWNVVLETSQIDVRRIDSAIVKIDEQNIAVFGGTGYIFQTEYNTVQPMLGS